MFRVGKCVGRMANILSQFDEDNSVSEVSSSHTTRSSEVDFKKMLKQLHESKVFDTQPGRFHNNFPKFD